MAVRMIRRGMLFLTLSLFIVPALALLPAQPAGAAGTVGDGTPESCTESALEQALAGGGLVTFNCGGAPVEIEITSEKSIESNTRIEGDQLITLTHSPEHRVFFVTNGATLQVDGLTIRGLETADVDVLQGGAIHVREANLIVTDSTFDRNQSSIVGGAISFTNAAGTISSSRFTTNFAENSGGAIHSLQSDVAIHDSVFEDNGSDEAGGAITFTSNSGTFDFTITGSNFLDNFATGFGGAIFQTQRTNMTIERSTFEGNRGREGGAIRLFGLNSTIRDSSFIDNAASVGRDAFDPSKRGGAISHGNGDVLIEGSTFTENFGRTSGGAIYHRSHDDLDIVNSTFSGNLTDEQGGAIYSEAGRTRIFSSTILANSSVDNVAAALQIDGTIEMQNSIIGDHEGIACGFGDAGELISGGFNLIDIDDCIFFEETDILVDDVLLGDLTDNGGPTLTHLPLEGSPAIDAGGFDCPATDQRGILRPQGRECEIGAVEIVNPIDLCANQYNGDLRVPRTSCASTEIVLLLPEDAPVDLCVNRFNGDARYTRTGACASTETALEVQGDGSVSICVNRYNGDVRVPRVAGQCASTETPRTM